MTGDCMEYHEIAMILREKETAFFHYKYTSNREWLEHTLHAQYSEFGSSGCCFQREEVIHALSALTHDRSIEMDQFRCEQVSEDTYLIHYVTQKQTDRYYRTSLWVRENEHFQLRFHQASLLCEKTKCETE